MESQNKTLLVVGRCSKIGSDILYIKKMRVNSVGHGRDEKILQLYTILVVPLTGIYVLEAFKSSKSITLVTKTCVWGVSSFSLLR